MGIQEGDTGMTEMVCDECGYKAEDEGDIIGECSDGRFLCQDCWDKLFPNSIRMDIQ